MNVVDQMIIEQQNEKPKILISIDSVIIKDENVDPTPSVVD